MTLDYSGNLGLGVTPSAWDAGTFKAIQVSNGLVFAGQVGAASAKIGTNWFYDGSYKYIANGSVSRYDLDGDSHKWYIAPSGTAGNAISFTQAMTLDASGNLLVGGTSSSGERLQVTGTAKFSANLSAIFNSNSNTPYIRFDQSSSAKFFIGERSIVSGSGGTGYDFYSASGNDIQFFTNGSSTSRLAISTSGNVGIGTSSPAYKLDVFDAAGTSVVVGAATGKIFIYGDNAGGTVGTLTSIPLRFSTNGTENMRITSGGNVGIGTTNPTNKLQVVGGRTFIETGNEIYTLGLSRSGANAYYLGISNSGSPDLYFSNNAGTTRVTFTDGGNVGIGTTSPDSKLVVSGSGTVTSKVVSSDNQANVYLQGTFGQFENAVGDLYITNNAASSPIIFRAGSATERMRITSGGEILVNTTSDAGDYKLQVNGNGLFTGRLLVNNAADDADIAMTIKAPSGVGKYIMFGRDASDIAKFTLSSSGDIVTGGSIKTAAPSGGTAGAWKLGTTETFSCTPGGGGNGFSTTVVRIDIGGTAYFIPTVTDGWC
jgi:uncharacterized protein YaiE (UPF0345 family)